MRERLKVWHTRFANWPFRMQFILATLIITTITSYGLSSGIFAGSGRAFADSNKIVSLYVDGDKRVVSTDAATVGDVITRLGVKVADEDLVEPSASTHIPQGFFNINIYRARPVVVIDGQTQTHIRTAFQSPRLIVSAAGLTTYPEDVLSSDVITNFVGQGTVGQSVSITRAKPFSVQADGKVASHRTQSSTIAEALADAGVSLGQKDTVQPALTADVTPGMRVVITRVTEVDVTVDESIARPVKTVRDGTLLRGAHSVREAGSDGKRKVTYHINYQNGVETGRKTLASQVVTEPVGRVEVVGTKIIDPNQAVVIAAGLAGDRGWIDGQWDALYSLWSHESNFNATSVNASSGACGIPQAYPCSKLPGFSPMSVEAQVNWGLDYIAKRYGTPASAWAYWQSHHSY